MLGTQNDDTTTERRELSPEERQMRVLIAIHGGLGDDLLPGVEPFLDQDALPETPWPRGWVSD